MSHLNDYLIPCKSEELAKAWTDGDPLGGGLPAVTAEDDGKVLTVIDGSWGAGEASGDGGLVLDVSTLTVPTYNGVEIDSLYVSSEDEVFNLIGVGEVVYVGGAPENAVILKTPVDAEINYSLIITKYDFSVDGLATSEGEKYCITNDVTIRSFQTAQESIYVIPANAVIAPYTTG